MIWAAWQQAGVKVDKEVFREVYVYAEREPCPHPSYPSASQFPRPSGYKDADRAFSVLQSLGQFPPEQVEPTAKRVAEICYASAKASVERAKSVLDVLAKRYPMVLVSNFYGNVETVLKDFGIDGYFKKIIESAVVGVRKPDPKIFTLGVEALGLKPEEVLVFGDSYSKDIIPAEKAGCQVMWIKGKGWTKEEDDTFHPNIIRSLDEGLGVLLDA